MAGFSFIISVLLLFALPASGQLSFPYSIPERQIILNELFPTINTSHDIKIKVHAFELSKQVTLKEYKEFLSAVKKDSGEAAYQKFLPDTSIAPKSIREKYFGSAIYDDYPVVGISWNNALKYCRWLTLKNKHDSLQTIYRLPNLYEYYAAYLHMQKNAVDNDLNQLYADWLMDVKDETPPGGTGNEISLSYYYFHAASDPASLKRKMVIGQSFHLAFAQLTDYLKLSFYADSGYSYIGFRVVKFDDEQELELNSSGDSYENPLLKFWNIKPGIK